MRPGAPSYDNRVRRDSRPPQAGLGEENPVFCKIEIRRNALPVAARGFF